MNKLFPLVGLASIFVVCSHLQASSAVAVAINKQGGLGYGYHHAANITEAEAGRRAIQACLAWGGRDPKIIASTSMGGYGAIVEFQTADNRTNYVASLTAASQQQAINDASRKAKAQRGHNANVVATWRDLSAPPAIHQYPNGAKEVAIYAPKPDYPFEARSRHLTGSGVIMLDVDVHTGRVTNARMLQSIGHRILDDAALAAFRKWRFKPGKVAPQVRIPIRYTMSGTTY